MHSSLSKTISNRLDLCYNKFVDRLYLAPITYSLTARLCPIRSRSGESVEQFSRQGIRKRRELYLLKTPSGNMRVRRYQRNGKKALGSRAEGFQIYNFENFENVALYARVNFFNVHPSKFMVKRCHGWLLAAVE